MIPTRLPDCASEIARFTAMVDLPTPPLPLDTATILPRPGIATGVGADGLAGAGGDITGSGALPPPAGDDAGPALASITFTVASVTPGTFSSALRMVSASCGSSPGSNISDTRTFPDVVVAMSRTF